MQLVVKIMARTAARGISRISEELFLCIMILILIETNNNNNKVKHADEISSQFR